MPEYQLEAAIKYDLSNMPKNFKTNKCVNYPCASCMCKSKCSLTTLSDKGIKIIDKEHAL